MSAHTIERVKCVTGEHWLKGE
ncbi:hypothetical protein C343_02679 [Cryptococcus neoformans C23]|nr:hypothetical protein C343_02679 [Cryptococcus neoformans var. grubii C23]